MSTMFSVGDLVLLGPDICLVDSVNHTKFGWKTFDVTNIISGGKLVNIHKHLLSKIDSIAEGVLQCDWHDDILLPTELPVPSVATEFSSIPDQPQPCTASTATELSSIPDQPQPSTWSTEEASSIHDETLPSTTSTKKASSIHDEPVSSASSSYPSGRHVQFTNEEIDAIAKERLAPNTEQQTKWAVNLLKDFLHQRGRSENFEHFDNVTLADTLRELYACVRQRSTGGHPGKEYGRSGYRNMRAGIQRHLVSPPFSRRIDIARDKEFQGCNQVFEGKLKLMKREGKDFTKHKMPISNADMKKMYDSGVLSINDPISLQRKVFVELGLHFGRRGREGWRGMKKDSFAIKIDHFGRKYVCMLANEFDKNHAGDEIKTQLMFEDKDSDNCPVKSFEFYVSKLHPMQPAFFQRPDPKFQSKGTWYVNAPIGVNTISNMLKGISQDSHTAVQYTNHCLKATTATVLKEASIPVADIMSVTGHKNPASLNSYISGPSTNQRAQMSKILANYSQDPVSQPSQVSLTNSETQNKSMALDLTSSLFSGATFTGPVTFNIQFKK